MCVFRKQIHTGVTVALCMFMMTVVQNASGQEAEIRTVYATERVTSTEWACRNTDFEIACDAGGCSASEDHTPMEASVGLSAISVCAYSGCWEGAATAMLRSGTFLTIKGTALPFSTDPSDRVDISVTIETASRVGTLLIAGRYATPVMCEQR